MTEEQFIAAARAKYAELNGLKTETNLFEYEKKFVEIWTSLGQEVIQSLVDDGSKDRRGKKK